MQNCNMHVNMMPLGKHGEAMETITLLCARVHVLAQPASLDSHVFSVLPVVLKPLNSTS